jgi:DNA-binding response OmpR family regulator
MSQAGGPPGGNSPLLPTDDADAPDDASSLAAELIRALRHDIRTPIYHIVGYCEMWQETAEQQGRAELLAGLAKIDAAGRQLLAGVDAVLDLDRAAGAAVPTDVLDRDLRDPLAAIAGYAELLREEAAGPDDAELADDLHRIETAVQQALSYVAAIPPLLEKVAIRTAAPPSGRRDPGEVAGRSSAPAAVQAPIPPARLLVVDDNEVNRDLLARWLERLGHAVAVAEDGQQALATLGAEPFDLVLLDVVMPVMDGYQVLERLKADATWRDIPVIVLSALDDLESVVLCIQMGAADYLPKPFNPVLLRARVGACLAQKRLRDQEVVYLRQVARVTDAAIRVEAGHYNLDGLADVAGRTDALGGLARVFRKMARQVYAREERLKRQVEELRIEIDESKKSRQVAEITETEYFQNLRAIARQLRSRSGRDPE